MPILGICCFYFYVPVGCSFPTFFASYCCACSDTLDENVPFFLCRHSPKAGFSSILSITGRVFFIHITYPNGH